MRIRLEPLCANLQCGTAAAILYYWSSHDVHLVCFQEEYSRKSSNINTNPYALPKHIRNRNETPTILGDYQ